MSLEVQDYQSVHPDFYTLMARSFALYMDVMLVPLRLPAAFCKVSVMVCSPLYYTPGWRERYDARLS